MPKTFLEVLADGYREINKTMSSPEWISEYKDSIDHGTNRESYKACKLKSYGPCQPCIDAAKAEGKEYRSRKEVKDRLHTYNRTNRAKTNKSRFARSSSEKFNYFSVNTVIATYGSNCHLCNKAIDLKASRKVGAGGWELSLHIDHVLPLSKGGDDTLENVRPAHAQCNLTKGSAEK
jgi:5-methylcytosine-specific restriction endonuclease McrA